MYCHLLMLRCIFHMHIYTQKPVLFSLIFLFKKKFQCLPTHFLSKCINYRLWAETGANGNCIPTYKSQNAALKPQSILFQQTCNILEEPNSSLHLVSLGSGHCSTQLLMRICLGPSQGNETLLPPKPRAGFIKPAEMLPLFIGSISQLG